MITGFNTDVDHQGRVFHVQTEDKGRKNPNIESLVYCGGEIIASRKSSYEELAQSDEYADDEVQRQMESQHQKMIHDIFSGTFDTEIPKPFGHNIITNRSLDEVVLEFLEANCISEQIRVKRIDQQALVEGTRPNLRMQVLEQHSDRPVDRAQVRVTLISTQHEPRELFAASTDEGGFVEAKIEIPHLPGANAAIVCEVEAAGQRAELRQLIDKSGSPSVDGA